MFLAAVLLLFGVSAIIYTLVGTTSVSIANRQADDTARTLVQVKEALIGWSASRTPPTGGADARPGELPCPDMNNDGFDDGSCAAGAIGRVPWKTLGIPEPKDSSGETLWYAIAGPFRNFNMSSAPITSDTLGNLTVYLDSSATTLTSQAVAVIFAPGAALGAQDRSSTATAACTTTGTTIARNLCATNYLEATGGGDNAQTAGPFIQTQPSGAFNDRLLAITNADLMPAVEQRVAREMISYLNSYRATTGVYPWADLADGDSNGQITTLPYAAYNRSRFPCGTALPYNWGRSTAPVTPSLPNWLTNGCAALTGWASIIYYAVARNRLENGGAECNPTCTASTLTVNNSSAGTGVECTTASPPVCTPQVITAGNADLVLITPGAANASRASGWPTSFSAITLYFEDAENSDNDNTNDTYAVPSSTDYNRDRIYLVR